MKGFEIPVGKLDFETVRQRVLRHASSDPGRELIRHLTVSSSLSYIRRQLSCVSEMKKLLEQEEALPLEGIHPIQKALAKSAVEGAVLLPRELLEVGLTVKATRILRSFIAKRKALVPLLWEEAETLHADKVLEYNIEQAIDESGAVRASASRELQSVRRAIAEKYDFLRKRLESILRTVSDLGFSQEEIITTREGRMVIPVKAEHKNRVPGFIHSASASGATVFVEPTETLELNNEIRSLHFQEQREIQRILKTLTQQVATQRDRLAANLDVLAELDALHAKARYSIEILGAEPALEEHGPIRLVHARHPVLLINHGHTGTVPLDLTLGDSFCTLLISGPNAGGKSVAMKCVGLLTAMTQAGLHIPASERSCLRVFSQIFVDIGDEQSIESDLSTFSSHLRNLREIAEEADNNSLVLIDEIGSGTDPAEGGAIAAAVLERLTQRKAYTIATTHQGALKIFAHETEGIANGAMEFDQETLKPTYRFRPGIPGSSYAIEMADRLGFDTGLMERSREFLGHRQARVETLLAELEATAQGYRRSMEQLQAEKTRLDSLVQDYEQRIASLSAEMREMKRKAIDEAKQIVEQANSAIERAVREIRETGAERATVKRARQEISGLKDHIAAQEEVVTPRREEPLPEVRLGPGSMVTIGTGTGVGEVESVSADGKHAVVLFGSLKMRVALSELHPAREADHAEWRSPRPAEPEVHIDVQHELDIRGLTGDEAIPLVDKFIDTAVLAGLHRIDIIHGKGTGALRKKVSEFLSRHPRVKSFHLAEWNEGGTGATVVELGDA